MAIELVVIKTEDNGITSDMVNRLELSLSRERSLINDGFRMARLNILTDDKTGIKKTENIRFLPYEGNDKITNPDFLRILPHGGLDETISEMTKTIVLDGNIIARNLITSFLMDGIPDKGTCNEGNFPFTNEQRDDIRDNNLTCVDQGHNWWKSDSPTVFTSAYMGFNQTETKYMYDLFMENSVAIQEKYNTFQEWWEDTFDGFTTHPKVGLIGGYAINEEDVNLTYNKRYEEVVRPTFPENWRGIGGDESAKYIHLDHEYRTITKQTSILILEGEDDPSTDRYLELWIL